MKYGTDIGNSQEAQKQNQAVAVKDEVLIWISRLSPVF